MNLKRWRRLAGLSQRELAVLLQIAPGSLCNYEHGKRVPDSVMMDRIVEFTGGRVTAADFQKASPK
jgi:transcriptional regulator with XRE-family HTH domain